MSKIEPTPLVPYPRKSILPERDVNDTPVLETHHLGIDFGGLTAVDDFSIVVGKTEIAGLIGPNGAGKTTVFNLLTNVYQPTRGSIMINGFSSAGKSTHQVNRMGIARTFQNIRLFGNMSVEDNVRIGLHNQIGYSTVTASKFKFDTSILVLVFVVLGGIGNIRGSIIAATLLTILPELLRAFSDYRMLVYAIVLILVMLATNSPAMRQLIQRIIPSRKSAKSGKEGESA